MIERTRVISEYGGPEYETKTAPKNTGMRHSPLPSDVAGGSIGMSAGIRRGLTALLAPVLFACGGGDAESDLLLVTTTSTQDSGLLDVLVPIFERDSGFRVKTLAIGTGQALAMAARGEADVALVHAPALEERYMKGGAFSRRLAVMHNDFLLIGPADDPAGIRGGSDVDAAFSAIAAARTPFVSRGDSSGTHRCELGIWQRLDIDRGGAWYIEAGQGMGATLMIADEKRGHTLTDRGTYLAFKQRLELAPLVEGNGALINPYHVMEVDAGRFPKVRAEAARAFADFLVSPATQEIIGSFGVERHGSPLFFPDAQ